MKTENLSTLKIHKLTQAQYDRELAAGNIDENALYLTPDEETIQNITITVTLPLANWSDMSQTVGASSVTSSNTVIVAPAPISHLAYSEAGVYCSAQEDGGLTFTCVETPTTDLVVNVFIFQPSGVIEQIAATIDEINGEVV